ncbi:MAG TPA: FlgD immunoglobulin-like domain containing protein [Candidatus Limnocylindrales bacterium]|nr:FlgD immunoglobulin-like domain containing protein [Candidatus Limnocylindrales bacterium]
MRSFRVVFMAFALVFTGAVAAATPAQTRAAAAPLKAVIIVGPAGDLTAQDLEDAESLAVVAENMGMDVRRVFHPHATWENVMANIQGANLVYYAAHGYGWPSAYTQVMTESRQNGVGLNSFDGSSVNQYTYYGANVIRANWVLAPNSIVFLNHDCYTAGNAEPGMAIPGWDVARQRVDNFAAGFLAVGAKAVFAYSGQRFNKTVQQLFTTDMTVEQMFRTVGTKPHPYYGWVGWDARKFDSVRMPGNQNFMDPHSTLGFLRAVSGNLSLTAAQWAAGFGDGGDPPFISNLAATAPAGPQFGSVTTPFFTPNSDGVTDSMTLRYTVDKEAFVDLEVRNAGGTIVRTLSGWSPGGGGTAVWDGKNSAGGYVTDGTFTLTATPRNRAGATGNSESMDVSVLTVMSQPNAAPAMFYPTDNDNLAPVSNLSVTLDEAASFWWKISDSNGNPVRTHMNSVAVDAGPQTFAWDGKDNAGAYVPDGVYYSVTTTSTAAGLYYHSVPVEVRAFRATTAAQSPFTRGTKTRVTIASAEPMKAKPKVKVFLPGKTPMTYYTTAMAGGGWYTTVSFPLTAQPGTVTIQVFGPDANGIQNKSTYTYQLN